MPINHSHIIRLETIAQLPPADDTNFIQTQLQNVISELHENKYSQKSRHLTVAYHFRPHIRWHTEDKCVPRINLFGNWVQKAGFEIGHSVRVFPLNKILVICLDEVYLKQAI
jgi:hypothetical protein